MRYDDTRMACELLRNSSLCAGVVAICRNRGQDEMTLFWECPNQIHLELLCQKTARRRPGPQDRTSSCVEALPLERDVWAVNVEMWHKGEE